MKETYISIGHTKKAHGAKGEVKVSINDPYTEDFLAVDVVFLSIKGKPVPYFIEEVRESAGSLILKLEGMDSPNAVLEVVAKELFLRESDLLADEDREFQMDQMPLARIKGYLLSDQTLGPVGEVLDVVDFPQQEMALLEYEGKELYLPLHPTLIVKIDDKGKAIMLDLPDGILDL